jgi:putative ABC transport system permease protein
MNWVLLAAGGLVVLVYGAIGLAALRRPLLARLAARQAIRRRWQSALLVIGLMVATVAIIASLVGADSERDSGVINAQRAWGRVDLIVDQGGGFFSPSLVSRLGARLRHTPLISGVQSGIELVGAVADLDRQIGKPTVRVIGFDPASQPAFGAYLLPDGHRTFGQDLAPGEVLLSQQLADALDARVGDRLRVSLVDAHGTGAEDFAVAGVARSIGPGSYGLQPAIFAPLSTVSRLTRNDLINVIRISATGDGQGELDASARLAPAVRAAVQSLPLVAPLNVREVKAAHIQAILRSTESDRWFLVGMSLLVVVAAAALVVNLAIALAGERRPELGIMRALGLTRSGLVAAAVIEGALYNLAAALLAVLPGIAAGQVVAVQLKDAYLVGPNSPSDYFFQFSVSVQTLAVSIATGALITVGTLGVAALRTSQISIAAAVRDLPEPSRQAGRRWPRLVGLSALAVGTIPVLLLGNALGRLLGGTGVIVLAIALTGRALPERTRATLLGAALAGWAFVIGSMLNYSGHPTAFVLPFVLSLLVAVFGLSVLSMANLQLVENTASLFQARNRLRAVIRLPLAYLARRPVRTGLATGAIAVVLSLLALLAFAIGSSFAANDRSGPAGYDLRLTSAGEPSISLPAALAGRVARQVSIPTRAYVGPLQTYVLFAIGNETISVPLYEFSTDLLRHPPVRLIARYAGFDSDASVWRAMETGSWVVTSGGFPGETITLKGSRGPVTLRIAGTPQVGILDGVIGSARTLDAFQGAPLGDTVLLAVKPGVDARSLGRDVQRALFAQGVDASPTRMLLEVGDRTIGSRYWTFEVLLRIGLIIGVLTVGILALREVVERRHALGVMRALGFQRLDVTAGVMSEAVLTATIGVVVGCTAGGILGYLLMSRLFPDSVGIDWPSLIIALVLICAAVLVVTAGPAFRAAQLPPAQALRMPQ